ncbi:DNA-formamidopyrimidine glycosylase [Virgibacillus sp. W0181]|uniref:DNA-formamidopyrimidine glycosylase n=1 Tax=Virgibacillus sp. W0181 TaxID=3391581 RepID=UPI003F473566
MPELPEVETIKNTLQQLVRNKTIKDVTVYWPNIIKHPDDLNHFKHLLVGQTIKSINRKGKFLLFHLDDYVLVSHLRMEGKYSVQQSEEPLTKHTHVIFSLTNGQELRYNDVRKFGTMHLFPNGKELVGKPLSQLGPDPFEQTFTLEYLWNKLKKTERTIKAVLLDQTVVSGLGNIYVDEVLFKAKIHPLKIASIISKQEAKAIKLHAQAVLEDAVKQGGTTIRSYVNGEGEMGMFQQELFVYGQVDEPCKQCATPIMKMKVAGRGTHVCPKCQKD